MRRVEVTVVISVRNEADYIGATIKSILNQTFKNFELWVIDDGSIDSTWKIIKSFRDRRIRSFRFTDNQGLTTRLNWAVSQIKTKFIARMDSHNTARKDRLGRQLNYMNENSKVLALGSNYLRQSEDGRIILQTNFPVKYEEIRKVIVKKNVFKHASMFFRREVYDLVGLYDPYFKVAQDYDFIVKIAAKYPVGNLPDCLVTEIYRTANLSQQQRVRSAWEAFVVQWKAITKYSYPVWQAVYLVRGIVFLLKSILFKISHK